MMPATQKPAPRLPVEQWIASTAPPEATARLEAALERIILQLARDLLSRLWWLTTGVAIGLWLGLEIAHRLTQRQ